MVTRNTPCLVIDIISDEVVKITFYYRVWIGIYSVWLITIDTHPEVVKNIYTFYYYLWECNCVQMGSAGNNNTIFGFCHDSLNSLNSVISLNSVTFI